MARAKKFGAFGGVFTPSILTILGVIMYLRLPWIVGQAGLLATLGIILVAHIISMSTALSVSSIATDKKVETGGSYYIISRSLGLPIGGTLGFALFIGLSFSVSLYLIGFSETFLSYFGWEVTPFTIRVAGTLILTVLTFITFISTALAIKTQYLILTAMILSLLSVFLGRHEFGATVPQLYNLPEALPWIALFAIFFPAVTGFEAGVSMSGDLKDPKKDIPFGTIAAVLVGLAVYVGLAFFFSLRIDRYLLINDTQALYKIAWIPQLVVAGILGATLSSALGSILGAPRILQAIAIDKIAPRIFARGYGASNEPRNALLLAYGIALAGILIAELNVIARIVTIFFIITYGFLNMTYALESWASSDFRPSFKIPRLVSIIGALACILVMIQLDIIALMVASLALIGLFAFLKKKELSLQSGDTWSSIWASLVKTGLAKLTESQGKSRNWRPNVMLFSGGAQTRPHLLEMGHALVGKLGIYTNFELIETPNRDTLFSRTAQVSRESIGDFKNIVTRKHYCSDIYEGIEMISQIYGFSGFEPNTILMGWARNAKDPRRFIQLTHILRKLDFNLTMLNYHKGFGFGQRKRIDFWWNGQGRNLSLALHLIRFITSDPQWLHAEIRLLAINNDSRLTERYYALMQQLLDHYRIRATVKVVNNSVDRIPDKDIIKSESFHSDLTLLEIPVYSQELALEELRSINDIVESLKSTLLIHAASSFEEVSISSPLEHNYPETILGPSDLEQTELGFASGINYPQREILYNEVYNIAQVKEALFGKFYADTLSPLLEEHLKYAETMAGLSERTFDRLSKAALITSPAERQKELLRILSDLVFQEQKQVIHYREHLLPLFRNRLEKGLQEYLQGTEKAINTLPEKLRLRFDQDDYKALPEDPLSGKASKGLKRFWLGLSGRKITRTIRVLAAGEYFLYHHNLIALQKFSLSFRNFSRAYLLQHKTTLTSHNEMIEKLQKGLFEEDKLGAVIRMERDRLHIGNLNQIDKTREFFQKSTYLLIKGQASNIEKFGKLLNSAKVNRFSRKFRHINKKNFDLQEQLLSFSGQWHKGQSLLANKIWLDLMFLSLQCRIGAKLEKANQELSRALDTQLNKRLQSFAEILTKNLHADAKQTQISETLNPKTLKVLSATEYYSAVIKDIRDLIDDLPETLEIIGDISNGPDEQAKHAETPPIYELSVRKTANVFIGSELIDTTKKQIQHFEYEISVSVANFRDLIRLANFNLDTSENDIFEEERTQSAEQHKVLLSNLLHQVETEQKKIANEWKMLQSCMHQGLKNSFAPLSSAIITKSSSNLKRKLREADSNRLSLRLAKSFRQFNAAILKQMVKLLYTKSEGILWAHRMEQISHKTERHTNEEIHFLLERYMPKNEIISELPYYYSNLFSGRSGIGEDFWIGMEQELRSGETAIRRFKDGRSGALIISGERSSGKSSLSKNLAHRHFGQHNTFSIRAPKACMADLALFEQTLLKRLGSDQTDLNTVLQNLPEHTVIIFNDLELWWERKPFGTSVIEAIIRMIQTYGHRILFIINLNQHALGLIQKQTQITHWALEVIICQAFDARELKELIMLRHQAGGLKFMLEQKHETHFTEWDMARLFNRYFELSGGNPGYALTLWLASIQQISGKTLIMRKPKAGNFGFLDKLSPEEMLCVMQFILHRRFTADKLSQTMMMKEESLGRMLNALRFKGLIKEKFLGVYALNPALEKHLIDKLKSLKML